MSESSYTPPPPRSMSHTSYDISNIRCPGIGHRKGSPMYPLLGLKQEAREVWEIYRQSNVTVARAWNFACYFRILYHFLLRNAKNIQQNSKRGISSSCDAVVCQFYEISHYASGMELEWGDSRYSNRYLMKHHSLSHRYFQHQDP